MSNSTDLLTCPSCEFAVLPSDEYVLQLHFEQVHVEDSPFRILDDTQVSPPRLPPRPSSKRNKHVDESSEDDDNPEHLPSPPFRPSPLSRKLARGTPSDTENDNSVLCPEPDCGELILLSDFNEHLDYHAAETLSFDETTGKYRTHQSANMHGYYSPANSTTHSKPSFSEHNFNAALPDALRRNDSTRKLKKTTTRGRGDSSSSEKSTLSRSMASFIGLTRSYKQVKPPPMKGRLGKDELGPYHNEDCMPRWLHDQLADGPKVTVINRIGRDGRLIKQEQVENETPGIIPILAQLSALDRSVKEAYYCHPATLHIGKTKKEGGFCGYRNIQMLVSYIQGARAQGMEEFPGRTPGILKLQDLIERAWDKGINEIGRIQTGGIRDSRKYIGTPEAQALFLSSQIDCEVGMFSDSPDGRFEAHEQLLLGIESYFARGAVKDGSNVYKTLLPPIYLQQPGHSTTIVGFERHNNGSCNLMVFDPMHRTSPAMHRLIGRKNIKTSRPEILYPYRRAAKQLVRHAAFEVLMLTAHPPMVPVWDMLRQFPDCRFLYVFFRSRTLGYDVYPEDYFLRSFPWQQYGGFWIVDDARFARSDTMDPVTAQTLRRITGEGLSPGPSMFNSNGGSGSYTSCPSHQYNAPSVSASPNVRGTRSIAPSRNPSHMSSLDDSMSGSGAFNSNNTTSYLRQGPVEEDVMGLLGMHPVPHLHAANNQARSISLMTELGRRFPGYPCSLSPTGNAKVWYPSPASDIPTPRAPVPSVLQGVSRINIDNSTICGSSRRCASHGYELFTNTSGSNTFDNGHSKPMGTKAPSCYSFTFDGKGEPRCPPSRTITPTPSASSASPISPPRAVSPRTAILKNMAGKQALHNMSHTPKMLSPKAQPHAWLSINDSMTNIAENLDRLNTRADTPPPLSPPSIHMANGTEMLIPSSPSGTGTMLSYTSNRAVDSGLLAVRPLSEAQVAEYRFWRPCGRRACAFGCGEGSAGECAAAKRLFKDEEDVRPEAPERWDGGEI